MTGSAPVATEAQVRRRVAQWLADPGNGQVLALHARPQWSGDPVLQVGEARVRVVTCPSPLAMRAALVEHPAERLVVLTDCDEDVLGVGLLAHCSRLRVHSIDPWDLVRTQFRATALDPALAKQGRWLAEALIEYAPAHGWPPVAGSVLTRDHALGLLAARLLGLEPNDLDSAGVLQWTTRSVDVVRYAALPAAVRAGVSGWLGTVAGVPGRWAMACVDSGHGTDAIPLGLLAGLLWDDAVPLSTVVTAARVRLEPMLGGAQPAAPAARAWAEAAQAWVERAVDVDRQLADRVLARTEELARAVQAEGLLHHSNLLPSALGERIRRLADAVRIAVSRPTPATIRDAEHALRTLRAHRLAGTGPGSRGHSRVETAEMAVRLLRWLAIPDAPPPVTLAGALDRQVREDGWVDRARLDVWAGDSDLRVASAYRHLYAAVDARRGRHDEQFARLLAGATAADAPPGSMLRVEDVLSRVVRPILDAGRRALLLVIDGMSVAASTELVESITADGWVELTRGGGPRVGVLAALPTVTEVSRASLFAGRVTTGQRPDEQAALAARFGAQARLLHKADLRAGAGASLGHDVIAAIADQSLPLVAAVVNTIDDALDRSDPGTTTWSLETVRAVRDLLDHAGDRVVVLLSDHGHVVDRGTEAELRFDPAGPNRWRPAGAPAGDGEVLVTGPRVALGGGRAVLAWRETLRYSARKAGYHGGASPAEAVIPLTVLSTDEAAVPGWSGAPVTAPAWWRGTMPVAAEAALEPSAERLFELAPAAPSPPPPAAAVPAGQPPLVTALLASEIYRDRQRTRAAGRAGLPDERVAALLTVLVNAGGRTRLDTLAAEAGIPAHRIGATVGGLRRLLQVEGYPVLDIDPDGQTAVLDERLLREQFQLGSGP